jgi:hypothetical protein
MTGREHWDFFGELPQKGAELNRMCIWEYARECRPLIQAVDKLRTMVGSVLRIGDDEECARETYQRVLNKGATDAEDIPAIVMSRRSKKFRQLSPAEKKRVESLKHLSENWPKLVESIGAIVPRFNWRFLCSPGFPSKPWLLARLECGSLASDSLFPEPAIPAGGKFTVKVKYGKKKRGKIIRRLPKVYSIELAVSPKSIVDLFHFEQEIVEIAGAEEEEKRVHCFVIPDDDFLLYDSELLAAALRKQCHRLDRRRLMLTDNATMRFGRTNCSAYLRALGMMRLFHDYDAEERYDKLDWLQSRRRVQSITPAKWKEILDMISRADRTEARRTATEVLGGLFCVDEGERPVSY